MLLNAVLLGHPGRVGEQGSVGYYIDPFAYEKLLKALDHVTRERESLMQDLALTPPQVPTLPLEWPSDSLWSSKDLEVLCVTLRDDVDIFLVLYWDIVGLYKGTWKASKDDFVSPSQPSASDTFSENYKLRMEDVQIDNQPQNLKKYQMYFKRWVIILTLGVYNLNVQKFFECLQTF